MPDAAWEELDRLVRDHLRDGLRVALRLCPSPHDAEDILQEALLRVVAKFRQLEDLRRFRVWFMRILLNTARDWRRQRRRRREHTTPTLPDRSERAADASLLARELQSQLQQWIDALPDRQREALILTRFGGLSNQEAAEVMETTEQNVRALVSMARATLRDRLRRAHE